MASENLLNSNRIMDNLNSKIIGKQVLVYEAVSSTNSVLREIAKEGKSEGIVVVAQIQRTGYGRLNRTWFSPKGGLWFSIVLRPQIHPMDAPKITLMAGVAIATTLRESYNLNARIKWPNDVLISGKKICGILTEMRTKETQIEYVILGIGINGDFEVSELPKEIRVHATTLKQEIKDSVDLEEVLTNLLTNLDFQYSRMITGNSEAVLNDWRELSDTLGKEVIIKTQKDSIRGKVLNLDENGALMIRAGSGRIEKIFAGDCIHLESAEGK
jgi:BirA family biotin operon repressor/biotin-[acetyl-CoA-carboxylase] ligase